MKQNFSSEKIEIVFTRKKNFKKRMELRGTIREERKKGDNREIIKIGVLS